MRDQLSRRSFIRKTVSVGALGIGSAALLSACGKKDAAAGGDKKAAAAKGCMDVSGLTDAEKTMRTSLKYADTTADPTKACDLCALYQAAKAGAACGGCTLLKGPIAPKGTCTSFAKKA